MVSLTHNHLLGVLAGSITAIACTAAHLKQSEAKRKREQEHAKQVLKEAELWARRFKEHKQEQKTNISYLQSPARPYYLNNESVQRSPPRSSPHSQGYYIDIYDVNISVDHYNELESLINQTKLPSDSEDLRYYLEQLDLSYDQDEPRLLSRDLMIRFSDLRWELNGARSLRQLFLDKRRECMLNDDIHGYQCVVAVFEIAIEDRLDENKNRLLEHLPLTNELLIQSTQYHFAETNNSVWMVLDVEDYLHENVPESMTFERALKIQEEIGEQIQAIAQLEQQRLQKEIDLEKPEANYIRLLALDMKCYQYQINERILKKVIYLSQMQTTGSDDPDFDRDLSDNEFQGLRQNSIE